MGLENTIGAIVYFITMLAVAYILTEMVYNNLILGFFTGIQLTVMTVTFFMFMIALVIVKPILLITQNQ